MTYSLGATRRCAHSYLEIYFSATFYLGIPTQVRSASAALLAPQRHLCAMLAATHHASLGDSESVALHRPFVAVIDAGCDVS